MDSDLRYLEEHGLDSPRRILTLYGSRVVVELTDDGLQVTC